MSDLPMTVPEGQEVSRFAELVLFLPPSWPLDLGKGAVWPPQEEGAHDTWYWPIQQLKWLARFPHHYKTWLGFGHTVPNGDPPRPFTTGTRLCSSLLLPPVGFGPDAGTIMMPGAEVVNVYVLHFLHPEELQLKLVKGTDKLLDAFDAAKVSQVLDSKRASSVRRKLFGLL